MPHEKSVLPCMRAQRSRSIDQSKPRISMAVLYVAGTVGMRGIGIGRTAI